MGPLRSLQTVTIRTPGRGAPTVDSGSAMGAEATVEGVGPLQPLAKALAGGPLRLYYRLSVEGAERIPREGAAIVAANHESMWDIPLLVVASPRPIVFMAKEGLFDRPFKDWFFTRLGGFPVVRGGFDISAMKRSLGVLREGRLLGMFPEGTRIPGRLGPFLRGAARIALAEGAPIVPAGISGTERIWPKGARYPRPTPVRIRFGEPIRPRPLEDRRLRREVVENLTDHLRGEVARLLEG